MDDSAAASGDLRLPNTTNLHVHGLHVSPEGVADNVFRQIRPGESATYEYELPANHPSGTFWYHPHHHHSTTLQLASGMSGAIVVQDLASTDTFLREMRDVAMLLRVVSDDPQKNIDWLEAQSGGLLQSGFQNTTAGPWTTVNGQVNPTIVVEPVEALLFTSLE